MAAVASNRRRWRAVAIWGLALGIFCWVLPPFHVRTLDAPAASVARDSGPSQSPAHSARELWKQMLGTQERAVPLSTLLAAFERDPGAAEQEYGRRIGHGGPAFFFVTGSGRVLESTRKGVVLEIAEHSTRVLLVTGPVFGNSLRDSTSLVQIGDFDSFQFNALSAELNLLSEREVQPRIAALNRPGEVLNFTGGARFARRGGALEVVAIDVSPLK
ncbi:DUF2291 family protein [Steroidobacter agaridevorans]|uniref:DUF2291 family protein n=1 Tax=Steroidobacter agaridevorans TaxID=2695856 RepID=UPI0013294B76|nr:DUF2291 family protein [Steroidobacter agaridevorans]GFE87749.1 hypothetical protein GCM10011488_27030 [Steroidobacter agaridevorans]